MFKWLRELARDKVENDMFIAKEIAESMYEDQLRRKLEIKRLEKELKELEEV